MGRNPFSGTEAGRWCAIAAEYYRKIQFRRRRETTLTTPPRESTPAKRDPASEYVARAQDYLFQVMNDENQQVANRVRAAAALCHAQKY